MQSFVMNDNWIESRAKQYEKYLPMRLNLKKNDMTEEEIKLYSSKHEDNDYLNLNKMSKKSNN